MLQQSRLIVKKTEDIVLKKKNWRQRNKTILILKMKLKLIMNTLKMITLNKIKVISICLYFIRSKKSFFNTQN